MAATIAESNHPDRAPEVVDLLRYSSGPKTACAFPTVTAAFYHHAQANPNNIAAHDLSSPVLRRVTYAELAHSSRLLALQLRSHGVRPGDRVPLVVKRGVEALIGIFAILSCGAQYVPLDGGVVPDSTLRYVLDQCGSKLALCLASTEYRVQAVVPDGSCKTLVVDQEDILKSETSLSWEQFTDLATPDLGCYVIYTSGTTGLPKGVDVTHQNVTNLVTLAPGNLGISPGARVGQVLSISFDMAAWEILGCLCNGGTLVLRGSNWEPTIQQIDVLICTPSILSKYNPENFPRIKTVATAGEPSSQRLADLWAAHGTYYNCCGPTETTIVNTMHRHQVGQPLSIGRPTPNNTVYVLDSELKPVSGRKVGVMWAGGLGVSKGYIGLAETTSEKYTVDKFANDGMMYNTGDLGRWNADGSIDILGRVDDQIKIKGFRVELDGVASSIASFPGVSRSVSLLIDDEIHAFLTPRTCDIVALQEHLRKCQPYYAVPERFHLLDNILETTNGKVDKRALRALVEHRESAITLLPSSTESDTSDSDSMTVADIKVDSTVVTEVKVDAPSTRTSTTEVLDEKLDLSEDLPDKLLHKPYRGLRHRIFIVYRFVFSIVGLANAAALITILVTRADRQWFATLTAMNLVLAVIIRQDFVINALYTITCSVPKSWPLAIRRRCGKIYHLGGTHSGAAFCAAVWLLTANISNAVCSLTACNSQPKQSIATSVISWLLMALFLVMFGSAWPTFRKRNHNLFEKAHRFVGWTMLGLFWVQTVLSINDGKGDQTLGEACLRAPTLWLLTGATCSIASSWLFLRKVPVEAEVLSNHAVRLHFGYTVPVNGSFTRLSRRPLLEWHSFATIPAPEAVGLHPKGYSLVVSNAGDWTKNCIQNPPTKLWVRGVATCGVMRIATLFNRVVIIATGSGIGPLLGHIQNPICPTQLIWSTPNPEQTFGREMLDTIKEKIPNAVIHDTKILGRPDLVKMGYNLAKSFGAEAVIIIANEKITKKICYGLETRGVPAYGAIWDS